MKTFGLRKKLILFVTVLAVITYSTSAVFLYWIRPAFFPETNAFLFAAGTFLLGILWSGILAAGFSSLLIRPLLQLEQAARQIAEGKIGQDISLPKSSDEIRSVAEAFQLMVTNLRGMVEGIESSFSKTNEAVKALTEEAATAADQADAIAMTTAQISLGAQSSASAVQETSEAVEDIRILASQVNARAEQSAVQSGEMTAELDSATGIIDSLIDGIRQVSDKSGVVLTHVRELEENAGQIEQISHLVGGIAEQTNLLALNASIEAARAGEQGKGFAVVAEEVRKLADQSRTAVHDISERINTIQENVQTVVSQISGQVSFAAAEGERAAAATAAISRMGEKVREMAASVEEISAFVERQLHNVEETARQTQEVAAIAEETSAGAQEVRGATDEQTKSMETVGRLAGEVRAQSDELYAVIQQFDRSN